MTKYNITVYSKNKNSLNCFFRFLKHNLKIQSIQTPLHCVRKKKKKKKITVLKSPHVYKTAQEQFEYTIYSIKISFHVYRAKKYLVLLKKIKNQLFPDIKIKINLEGSLKDRRKFINLFSLNPNNLTFNIFKFNFINQRLEFSKLKKEKTLLKNKNLLKKTSNYLKLLEWYGVKLFG
jgi:ribosomal protein S10